jgi:hypothetical protein
LKAVTGTAAFQAAPTLPKVTVFSRAVPGLVSDNCVTSNDINFDNSPAAGLLHRLKLWYPLPINLSLHLRNRPCRPHQPFRTLQITSCKIGTFSIKTGPNRLQIIPTTSRKCSHVGEGGGFLPKPFRNVANKRRSQREARLKTAPNNPKNHQKTVPKLLRHAARPVIDFSDIPKSL